MTPIFVLLLFLKSSLNDIWKVYDISKPILWSNCIFFLSLNLMAKLSTALKATGLSLELISWAYNLPSLPKRLPKLVYLSKGQIQTSMPTGIRQNRWPDYQGSGSSSTFLLDGSRLDIVILESWLQSISRKRTALAFQDFMFTWVCLCSGSPGNIVPGT